MKYNREKSEVTDFLFSPVLHENWKEGDRKILDQVVSGEYIELIEEYHNNIEEKYSNVYKLVSSDFNLLFIIFLKSGESHWDRFLAFFRNLTPEDLKTYIREEYEIEKDLDIKSVENLELSDSSRWKILYCYNYFGSIKDEVYRDLQGAYSEYVKYRTILISSYDEDIKEEIMKIEEGKYDHILKKSLGSHYEKNKWDEFVISLFSFNTIKLYLQNNSKEDLLSIGLYSLKYLEKLETLKDVNPDKVQEILKSLADPTRYNILKSIKMGINSNKILSKTHGISPAGVTYQLNILQESELITYDNSSKKYDVNIELLEKVLSTVGLEFTS